MNMPDPMNKSSFNSLNEEIANFYNYIAEASMNDAAKEVRIISLKENYDYHIVIDEDISGDELGKREDTHHSMDLFL